MSPRAVAKQDPGPCPCPCWPLWRVQVVGTDPLLGGAAAAAAAAVAKRGLPVDADAPDARFGAAAGAEEEQDRGDDDEEVGAQ
jgi:hypothetical protein